MRGSGADDTIDRELMRHQVETRTEPATDLTDIRAQLIDARRRVGEAAREAGAAAVATGTAPFGAGDVRVIFLESEPTGWGRGHQRFQVWDPVAGLVVEGSVAVADLIDRQPWLDERYDLPVAVDTGAAVGDEPVPVA